MRPSLPDVSVVICTRHRGARLLPTLESVLALDHPSFELIVVDQSSDRATADAVAPWCADGRLRYVPAAGRGLGRARNVGLAHARAAVVAFTDDDCTVPPDWLTVLADVFARHPRVAVAFCNVRPAPHDVSAGFIPHYLRHESRLVRSLWGKCTARGIGAGLAVRRDAVQALGGFDDFLGAGAHFPSCEDGDMAVRALLGGWQVFESAETAVTHDGFRTWAEGRDLTRRDWTGIGAAYAKPLRCGRWRVLPVVLYEGVLRVAQELLAQAVRGRRPRGVRQFIYFWRGFAAGLRAPVACRHILFTLENGA